MALLKNGHYFHNNAENHYAGNEFRYVLDPAKAADSWFYDLIRDGNEILGMAGTATGPMTGQTRPAADKTGSGTVQRIRPRCL